ncbi:MAG: cadherin-like domain-containing protein [Rhodobacteraceae bacterium]|nr:cadherin-like domain-containing protein [Paracoccaceae bacterium]
MLALEVDASAFVYLLVIDTSFDRIIDTHLPPSDVYVADAGAAPEPTVIVLNENPIAGDDTVTASEGGDTILLTLLDNDSDPDGPTPTILSVDDSLTTGSVINNGDGTVTYTADASFEFLNDGQIALDTFSYIFGDADDDVLIGDGPALGNERDLFDITDYLDFF